MGSIWNKMANCCKLIFSLTKSKMRWCSDISLTNRTVSRSNMGVIDFWTSRHFSALKIRSEILKKGKKMSYYLFVCPQFAPENVPKMPSIFPEAWSGQKCRYFSIKLSIFHENQTTVLTICRSVSKMSLDKKVSALIWSHFKKLLKISWSSTEKEPFF